MNYLKKKLITIAKNNTGSEVIPELNKLFDRKITTGTFIPRSKTSTETISHEDVGVSQAIYIFSNDPLNKSNYEKWGELWLSSDYSGIENDTSRSMFLTFANGAVNAAKRTNSRISQISNSSFNVSADSTYGWKENTEYTYLVVGDTLN